MIEQYFESKRTPVPKYGYKPPVLALPGVTVEEYGRKVISAPSAFETARAEKMGLEVEVYRHRVTEVSRAQTDCKFSVGDTVWPVNEADVIQYGMCQVIGVCRHYNDYGTVDWHEPPFILSIQSMRDRTEMLNTTANWVQKVKPVFETENVGDC